MGEKDANAAGSGGITAGAAERLDGADGVSGRFSALGVEGTGFALKVGD